MVKIREEDVKPVCPHCKKELDTIVVAKRKMMSLVKVFCCEHCRAVLGTSVT
jgi:hypothetical protein